MMAWFRKHNVGTKALALIGAIFLWFFVIEVTETSISNSVVVQVELRNQDALSNRSLALLTSSEELSVRVTLTGNYKLVTEFVRNYEQFGKLYLDLNNYSRVYNEKVTPKWEWAGDKPEDIAVTTVGSVQLKIESVINKPITVKPIVLTGTAPESYSVEASPPDPAVVIVSGPSSMVEPIAEARASHDITGIREAVSTNAQLHFYDSEGKELDLSSEMISIESQTVRFSLRVRHEKAVNLKAEIDNLPTFLSEDAILVQSSPESIDISGEPDDVEAIHSISLGKIDITAFLLSEEDYNSGYILREIEIENGIDSDLAGEMATVYISFPGYVRQTLTITEADLPENADFQYAPQEITLTLFGIGEDGEEPLATAENLSLAYNYVPDSLGPGEHEIEVQVTCGLPDAHVISNHRLKIIVPEPVVDSDLFD